MLHMIICKPKNPQLRGFFITKWPETESNCRHEDFQSSALPTELSGQFHPSQKIYQKTLNTGKIPCIEDT